MVTLVITEVTTCHDYKLVNIIHNPHINHNVIPISTFGLSKQASPISKGVMEIRIISHLAREIT
jgi:hypothetical protein